MKKRRRAKIEKPTTVPDSGNALFEKVALDILHENRDTFDGLTEHERAVVLRWFADSIVDGNPHTGLHDTLWEIDFIRKPVDIETFVKDDYYLGRTCQSLRQPWMDDLKRVLSPGSQVFEWVMCLTGDTLVPLLNGQTKTLAELHAQFETDGKPVNVYSYREDGQIVPGEATKVSKFKEDAIFKVTLDDGTSLRGNADHELVCRDGVKRKIRDLAPGDRLMPFNTRNQRQKGQRLHAGYEQVYIPGEQVYAYTHRMVARALNGGVDKYVIDGDRAVVHHKDHDCRNNDPSNLEFMGFAAHRKLHTVQQSDAWRAKMSKLGTQRARDPHSQMRRGHLKFMRSAAGRKLSRANIATWNKLPPDVRAQADAARTAGTQRAWDEAPQERRDAAAARLSARSVGNTWGKASADNSVGVDAIYAAYEASAKDLGKAYKILGMSRNRVVRVLRDAGLTVADLKSGYRNHRIMSIESDGREAVFCLTVPDYGNFAIVTDAANRCGIFSGNTGSIGAGKTTVAMVALAYKVYWLSCLRNAAAYYGQLTDASIVFGIYSITKKQVNDAGYSTFLNYIDTSPYFLHSFPRNRKKDSTVEFTQQNIMVLAGSRQMHAVGLNLLSLCVDEANFMVAKADAETGKMIGQAYELYNGTQKRILSRFMRPNGHMPGLMMLMSSKTFHSSFIDERIAKGKNDPTVLVSDYALWEIKTELQGKKWFTVEIGDRFRGSRILQEAETPRDGAQTVKVPESLRKPFEDDLDAAIRDIAGRSTVNTSPLIHDRQSILDAVYPGMQHPFTQQSIVIDVNTDDAVQDYFLIEKACRIVNGKWQPRMNPGLPRFAHIDIGLRADCLGFGMAHVSGMKVVERLRPDTGVMVKEHHPFVVVDMMLEVRPPRGSEIDLSKIRAWLLYLRSLYNIVRVTYDGYQSSDSVQILNKSGMEAGLLSLDRDDEAYLTLRAAHSDRRIGVYDYKPYIDQVSDLLRDAKKRKVDHPAKGSNGLVGAKDVADGVCGALWACMTDDRARVDVQVLAGSSRRSVVAKKGDPMTIATGTAVAKPVNGVAVDWSALKGQ